jgi:hypothetical protein
MSCDMPLLPTDNGPYVTADFVVLTPGQARHYEEVKEIISAIVDKPDGLMFTLNAVALTNDTALSMIRLWVAAATGGRLDARDLAGIIGERPLTEPRLTW